MGPWQQDKIPWPGTTGVWVGYLILWPRGDIFHIRTACVKAGIILHAILIQVWYSPLLSDPWRQATNNSYNRIPFPVWIIACTNAFEPKHTRSGTNTAAYVPNWLTSRDHTCPLQQKVIDGCLFFDTEPPGRVYWYHWKSTIRMQNILRNCDVVDLLPQEYLSSL